MVCTSIQIYTYGSQISRSQQLELKINTGSPEHMMPHSATYSLVWNIVQSGVYFIGIQPRERVQPLSFQLQVGISPTSSLSHCWWVVSPPNNEQIHKTHMDQCHTTCTGFSLQFSILAASWKEFDDDLLNDTHIENWGIERKLQHMLTCTCTCRDL